MQPPLPHNHARYDNLNRITQKSFNDGSTPTVKYGYDALALTGCTIAPPTLSDGNPVGSRTSMCDGAGAESWSHDSMERILTDLRTNIGAASFTKSTAYTYNLDGSVKSITYPYGRTITYAYNGAGHATSAIDSANNKSFVSAATYAPQGDLATLVNDSTYTFTSTYYYNNRLQPCRVSARHSGVAPTNCADNANLGDVMDYTYNFVIGSQNNGNAGAITNNRTPTRSQTFSYDSINRIGTAQTTSTHATSAANCWAESYVYDAWGNLLSNAANPTTQSAYSGCTVEAPANLTGVVDQNNRLNGFGYATDAAGNLTSDSTHNPFTFTYDAENHLLAAPGVSYKYDGDGKRITKSNGTIYWYGAGSDPLDRSDLSANLTSTFVYFNGRRVARYNSGQYNYYFADHLGTPRAIVQSGNSALCYDGDFYPFGGERIYTNSCQQSFKFTGKERDTESSFDYFGARYDASSIGRFVSPDTSFSPRAVPYAELGDPQSLNSYSYSSNNPMSAVDRTGHAGEWLDGAKRYFQALVQPILELSQTHFSTKSAPSDDSANSERPSSHAMAQAGTKGIADRIQTIDDVYSLADVTGMGQMSRAAMKGDNAGFAAAALMNAIPEVGEVHHLLPRQFVTQFAAAGLNIEKYTIRLAPWQHRLKPYGLHTIQGGNWNAQWARFFALKPNATKEEILKFLEELKAQHLPYMPLSEVSPNQISFQNYPGGPPHYEDTLQ